MRKVFQSEVDGLAIRRQKQVVVVNAEQYDPDFPPTPLLEFQAWLEAMIEDIPEEYRGTATVEFDSAGSYYDSHYAKVEISYYRPETDEEWAARRADVEARLAAQQNAERAAYEALKQKFG